jgi:hypothetical protein
LDLLPDRLDLRRHDLQGLHRAQEEWQCAAVAVVGLQCIQAVASPAVMVAVALAAAMEEASAVVTVAADIAKL